MLFYLLVILFITSFSSSRGVMRNTVPDQRKQLIDDYTTVTSLTADPPSTNELKLMQKSSLLTKLLESSWQTDNSDDRSLSEKMTTFDDEYSQVLRSVSEKTLGSRVRRHLRSRVTSVRREKPLILSDNRRYVRNHNETEFLNLNDRDENEKQNSPENLNGAKNVRKQYKEIDSIEVDTRAKEVDTRPNRKTKRNAKSTKVSELGTCQWNIIKNTNDKRYPRVLPEANCRSDCPQCKEQGGTCQPVSRRIFALKVRRGGKVSKKANLTKAVYTPTYVTINVACVCVKPR